MLGVIAALYEVDWNNAERCFRLAIAREPVPPLVRSFYAFSYLLPMGRLRESAEEGVRGLEGDPLNFNVRFRYATGLLAAGDDEAGEAELLEVGALHPNLYQPFYLLGLSRGLRGRHAEALAAAESAYSRDPSNTGATGLLAGALMRAGEKRRADELLRKLLPGDRYGTPMGLLLVHLMCPEMDRAADWAWKVFEERDPRLITVIALLRAQPRNVFLSESRWAALAAAMNVPPAA